MKEAVSRKKNAQKAMCQDNTEENKSMKNKAKKAVFKSNEREGRKGAY